MRILIYTVVLTLCGCAENPAIYEFSDWGSVGYDGFVHSIDTIAGANAKNCGFFNLIREEERPKSKVGRKCAQQAYKMGVSFKYGTMRLPTDSYAYEILVHSASGENWSIVYDIIIDGSDPQIWFKKCESIIFRRRTLEYEGQNCIKYDGSRDPVWSGS